MYELNVTAFISFAFVKVNNGQIRSDLIPINKKEYHLRHELIRENDTLFFFYDPWQFMYKIR